MKRVQLTLKAEGEKATQRWRITAGSLSKATDPRQISKLTAQAEQARSRVLRYNTDVKAFTHTRDALYAVPAHRRHMESIRKDCVENADGTFSFRGAVDEGGAAGGKGGAAEEPVDFESLLNSMKNGEA